MKGRKAAKTYEFTIEQLRDEDPALDEDVDLLRRMLEN